MYLTGKCASMLLLGVSRMACQGTCGRTVGQAALLQEVAGQRPTTLFWAANKSLCTLCRHAGEALPGAGAGVRV